MSDLRYYEGWPYARSPGEMLDDRDEEIEQLKDEIEQLRKRIDDCAPFLKEDETPAQRIERERADTEAVLKLLISEKREVERLRKELAWCQENWPG